MPNDGSANYSEETFRKQEHFRKFVRAHLCMCRGIISRKHYIVPMYQYIDLTPGPGVMQMGCGDVLVPGSPVIFLQEAYTLDMSFHARFIEIDPKMALRLEENLCNVRETYLETVRRSRFQVIVGDHHNEFPRICAEMKNEAFIDAKYFGLVYCDTNGSVPPFDMIGEPLQAPQLKHMDILIYLSATSLKRARGSRPDRWQYLTAQLGALGKEHLLVREKARQHQWTFVIATNWMDFPEFRKMGFHSVHSREGRQILTELSLTREELAQGHLFDQEGDDGLDFG